MTQRLELQRITRWLRPGKPVRVAVPEPRDLALQAVRLRAMSEADTKALAARIEQNDAHLFRWLPRPEGCHGAAEIAQHWVQRAIEGDADGSAWRRLAVLPCGTIVGGVNLIRIERGLDWQGDLNWWVASDQSGRGLGTHIVRATLDHAFADMPRGLGLHKVHAGIQPGHEASERVAAKAGFEPDAALDSRLLVNGEWQLHRGYIARV